MKQFFLFFILIFSNNLFPMQLSKRAHTLPKTVYGNWLYHYRKIKPSTPGFDKLCFCRACRRMYMWYKCKEKKCGQIIDVCNCRLKSFSAKHACPECKTKTINVDCPNCKKRVLMCNCSDTGVISMRKKLWIIWAMARQLSRYFVGDMQCLVQKNAYFLEKW